MINIVICGSNGRMGKAVAMAAADDRDVSVAAGVDTEISAAAGFPQYTCIADFKAEADVVIDFSKPDALVSLLEYCVYNKTPLILCTTGYSPEQLREIDAASARIPIFRSANMSLGINVLSDLVKRACAVLGGSFDVEVVERHHNKKVDAPSGTALMLADAAASALSYEAEYVYDRSNRRQVRGSREIGVSSVRGGSITGEHEVIFAGADEVIEIRHSAFSRNVFASGAIHAAKFMSGITAPGLYNMDDVLNTNPSS